MSKPTHYPLTMDEFLKLNTLLTDAELRVYLYLMIKNPFPDSRIEIDTAFISEQLGLTRRTVQRSIKRLSELQLIEIEITRFKYKKATHGASSKLGSAVNGDTRIANDDIRIASDDTRIANDDIRIASDDTRIANDDIRIASDDTRIANAHLKPLPDKASSTPQTNKTYTDFIQTLSDSERENFEKFVRDEWKKLTAKNGEPGEEIVSLERFLAREEDLKNWHQRFLKSAAGKEAKKKAIATSHDWHNDKRFDGWIWEAFNRGYEWVQENESEREQRKAFYDWAMATNAFEGVCL